MTRSDQGAAVVLGAAVSASAAVGLVIAAWSVVGPDHLLFPALVSCLWFGAAAFVGPGLATVLPQRWSIVSCAEVRWHRRLGVGRFDRVLEVVGWNRVVRAMRGGPDRPGRSGLPALQRHVQAAMAGHGAGAAVHVVVALACLLVGATVSSGLTAAAGAVLHGWPVLLQRSTLARIQRISPARPAGVGASP
ncbi:hypothetical protein [Cellulomonas wangsupingiae]|uniref:Glycosyl-4,4'-diaponeurosporenoate acyltransferase n=1 Tax=Cellulomonas wangsupingiae TaxID=2968085 RepID=A0ABY5K8G7_9CELL|nr:hypothetical protein [Cellulomonas wangsupingiae]MCC2334922.1 hypothetical protein [Cellulomonas wangsupingiae]UUI65422.1 hypothetical protein NP075_01390 [Cellulomonas wangsupingiae]